MAAQTEFTRPSGRRGAYEEDFLVREILSRRTYYANSPDTVQHVLLDHADNYVKSPLLRQSLRPLIGQGLLISEGALWRRQRRLMAPMLSPRRVLSFVPVMTSVTEAMLARRDALPPNRPTDIAGPLMQLTLEIIARTMFSDNLSGAIAALGQAATFRWRIISTRPVDALGRPVAWPPSSAPAAPPRRNDRSCRGHGDGSDRPNDYNNLTVTGTGQARRGPEFQVAVTPPPPPRQSPQSAMACAGRSAGCGGKSDGAEH